MSQQKMTVAGSFYPARCEAMKQTMQHFSAPTTPFAFEPKAIVVPHAGYIYSGECANAVYAQLNSQAYERVVVIGPSHHIYFEGVSVSDASSYETPCQVLQSDVALATSLKQQFSFIQSFDAVHHEHATETQMPFIAHYLPHASVLEVIYGQIDYRALIALFEQIVQMQKTLLVVSSDLSHFHALHDANKIDKQCIEAIEQLDVTKMAGCEACGKVGIMAMMQIAQRAQVLDYRTSFARSGDSTSVVGYLSAIMQ